MARQFIHPSSFSGIAIRELPTYELVPYRQEFNEEIIELQKYLWGPDLGLNSTYLEWKYQNNPYLKDRYIFLALFDGKPIGMVGVYGSQWKVDKEGQPWVIPCFGDLVIHPDHRHRGLFPKMVNFALDELSKTDHTYIFDWGGEEVALSLMMRGWRPIRFFQTGLWRKEDRTSLPRNRYRTMLSFIGSTYRQMRRLGRRLNMLHSTEVPKSFHRLDGVHITSNDKTRSHVSIDKRPHPVEMAQLVKRNGRHDRISHVRDAQYFNWRFQNPLSLYRFLYWKSSVLDGYLVLQYPVHSSWNTSPVNIVDWETSSTHILRDLLQVAISEGGFSGLKIWSETLSDEEKDVLDALGFCFENRTGNLAHDSKQPTLVTRPIQTAMFRSNWPENAGQLLSVSNWDLRMIYSDDF